MRKTKNIFFSETSDDYFFDVVGRCLEVGKVVIVGVGSAKIVGVIVISSRHDASV